MTRTAADAEAPGRPTLTLSADEARRVRNGADAHTEPDTLRALVADRSVTVRAALALNPAAPPEVTRALARDPDQRVRILLARRLAGLLPSLGGDDRAKLQRQTFEALTTLAADAADRVRAAIADLLKDMPNAPHRMILQLAQDPAVMVSAPVIRFSPLLTTDDLLGLITRPPSAGTVAAVAGRPGINTQVSDAVAATADNAAIRAFLCNHTAQIREATLDALVDRASEHLDWHEPLVRRPALTPRAVRALTDIVAAHLFEALALRTDLPPKLADDLRTRFAARVAAEQAAAPCKAAPPADEAVAEARAMARAGHLDETAALDAVRRGDVRLAAAMLAVAAGVSVSVVDRAASLRSAKGLVSLVWKAGFGMRAAAALQALLGRLGPDAILPPGPGGGFPLAIEEMRWQVEFLERMGR